MSFQAMHRKFALSFALLGLWAAFVFTPALAQEELNRRPKSKVMPSYPELARRTNLSGVVKVLVTVAPNGSVKDARLMGGHPVLAAAALEAVRKWRFEVAPQDSTGVVEFRFSPNQ